MMIIWVSIATAFAIVLPKAYAVYCDIVITDDPLDIQVGKLDGHDVIPGHAVAHHKPHQKSHAVRPSPDTTTTTTSPLPQTPMKSSNASNDLTTGSGSASDKQQFDLRITTS